MSPRHLDVARDMTADVPSDVAITIGLRLSTTTVRLALPHAPTVRHLPLAAVAVAQVVADPLVEVVAADAQLLADAHLADEGKWLTVNGLC